MLPKFVFRSAPVYLRQRTNFEIMKDDLLYYDFSRYSGLVPCQAEACELLAVKDGEWLCARLRFFRRRTVADRLLGRHPVEYGMLLYGSTPPPAGLLSFIRPFLADGVCMVLKYGEKKVPVHIAYCDPLGQLVRMDAVKDE